MRNLAILMFLVAAASARPSLAAQSAAPASAAMTNDDVVKMVAAGLSDQIVVGAIQQTKVRNFDLSPAALIDLKAKKVSDSVVAAMLSPSGATAPPAAPPFPGTPFAPPPALPNSDNPLEPHTTGVYLDTGEGTSPRLIQLTEATMTGNSVSGGWTNALTGGLTRMKWNCQVRDPQAEHRTANPTPVFYLYYTGDQRDYAIVKMKVKARDKEREFVAQVMGLTGSRPPKGDIEIVSQQVGQGIYKLTPVSPLQPGEYGFVSQALYTGQFFAMDFGVDRPQKK
jgi:hypothetical protein